MTATIARTQLDKRRILVLFFLQRNNTNYKLKNQVGEMSKYEEGYPKRSNVI